MMAEKRKVPTESRYGGRQDPVGSEVGEGEGVCGAFGQAGDSEKQCLCLCCVASPLCWGLELTGMGDSSGRHGGLWGCYDRPAHGQLGRWQCWPDARERGQGLGMESW